MAVAIIKQDLARLAVLQDQDKLIDAIQAAIDLIPKDIQALKDEAAGEKSRFNGVRDRAKQIQLRKKEKEIELAQKEEAARKHTQELNQVKTNEAFKALQSEIDRAKTQAGELETEILMLMEEADKASREEKAIAVEVKKAEASAEEQIKVLEGRKAEHEAKLQGEKAKREELAKGFASDLLALYDETRRRRQGVAMTKIIRGNMCEICHMTQPPQVVVNAIKGTKVLTCESCQRILYMPDAPSPAKAPSA